MQMSLCGGTFLRLGDDGTPVPLGEERFPAEATPLPRP
jgi:hypothetical protein